MTGLDPRLYPGLEPGDALLRFSTDAAEHARRSPGTLYGWELVVEVRATGKPLAIRIVRDVADRTPEAIAQWLGPASRAIGPDPDPATHRIYHLELPFPDDEGVRPVRIVYETIGRSGPTGERLARTLDPQGRWAWVGMRPPASTWWDSPEDRARRPQGSPDGPDGSAGG